MSTISIIEIDKVTSIVIENFSNIDPALFKVFKLLRLLICDKDKFAPLYKLYQDFLEFLNVKNWGNYYTDERLKDKLSTSYLHAISKNVNSKKFPQVHSYYQMLERSVIIIEPYIMPASFFGFDSHYKQDEIREYREMWNEKRNLLKFVKPFQKKLPENDTYYEHLNKFLEEIKDLRFIYDRCKIIY